ncbi:MAG: DUF2070 family protein [Salinigranum sp.]
MSATRSRFARHARFLFRAPPWLASACLSLLVAAVTGPIAFDGTPPVWAVLAGVAFLGAPSLAAGALTSPLDRALGGRMTRSAAALMALCCELAVVALVWVAAAAAALGGFGRRPVLDALLTGYAMVFALRLFVVYAASNDSFAGSVPAASVQSVAAVIALGGAGALATPGRATGDPFWAALASVPGGVGAGELLRAAFVAVVAGGGAYAVAYAVDRPIRGDFGVSAFGFVHGLIAYLADDPTELESYFERLGEPMVTTVSVASFRRPDGTEKARFVVPQAHPGPMGAVGGGTVPYRVAESGDGLGFAMHGAVDFDCNPVSQAAVDALVDAVERAADRIEYAPRATPSVRTSAGEATVLGQRFGADALLVSTFAPARADDIDYGVGRAAAAEARVAGAEDVLLVDAHNCNGATEREGAGRIAPGSRRSVALIRAAGEAGAALASRASGPLRLGVAGDETTWGTAEGIGPLGIRVAVVSVGGHRTAYALVDGNNAVPGLRERIVGAIEGVDEAEVLTTDSHAVTRFTASNPLGASLDGDRLAERICDLAAEAREDLEPVVAGVETAETELTVFGDGRTERFVSYGTTIPVYLGALVFALAIAVLGVSALVFAAG